MQGIDADNNSFWIENEQFQGESALAAIGIIGDDNRPRIRDSEQSQWKFRRR